MEDTSIQIDDHNAHNGKQECNLSKNFGDIRNYLTVSDDKFVSMPISEEKDVMRIGLKIDEVSRIEDAKEFKSASFRFYAERIYIFTREDDEFLHESTIKVETYDEKIFISNGNLFIYNENRKREDNLHKDPYPCISIYSTDNGNKFTTLKKSEKSYVKANDLFKDFEAKCDEVFKNKYIIKYDKIVGFNHDGKLVIKELMPDNWISYLRGTLKCLQGNIQKKYFVTWTLTYDYMNIILTAKFKNDKIEQSATKSDSNLIGILNTEIICDCHDYDNLVMVAYWGVLVWTFNTKNYKIELNRCWKDEGDFWD
ncbi:hypothetical protein C2G38_2242913 [Gigaspora rosea]|uniref:Uncharacterized protein n=1 Tax=Gigaspora rosea TaxID=44941 RepID=A0A397VKR2_9GLOM|nr:hypothetical protein C2G38_2242913 [Gigaspora rosea]